MDTISSYNRKYSLAGYILLIVLLLPPLALLVYSGYGSVPALVTDVSFLKQTGLALAHAALSTLAALILALPGIVIYAKCRSAFRKLLRLILAFAFCFPPLVMSMGFDCLFAEGGLIAELELDPVVRSAIINVMLSLPVFIVMVGEHWRNLDLRTAQTAASTGASKPDIFFRITLARLRPAIIGTFALLFLRNIPDIGNLVLSLVPGIVLIAVIAAADRRRIAAEAEPGEPKVRMRMSNAFTVIVSFIYMTAVSAMLIAPAVALVLKSVLTEAGFSISVYRSLFSALNPDFLVALAFCLAVSLASALASSFIAIHISVGIAESDSGRFVAMLPLAAGPMALAAGFGVFYMWIPQTVVAKMILALLCYILMFIPIQTMIIMPSAKSVPQTLRATSVSLGYSDGASFRHMELKMLGQVVRAGIFTAFALGIGSHGAAESLGLNTVFAQMIRASESGNEVTARAIASVILVLCFIFFAFGIGHTREVKHNV